MRGNLYTFKLTSQSSQGVIDTRLFTRASGMYSYFDSWNDIEWINKDWAGGHTQSRAPECSIYLADSRGTDNQQIV